MTTVVASAPSISVSRDHGLANLAHLAASAPPMITSTTTTRTTPPSRADPSSAGHSPRSTPRSVDENMSPRSTRPGSSAIKVKKEPASPQPGSSRPRPRRLDLSASVGAGRGPQSGRPSGPLTAKDSAHLALACLSPGIQTQDPAMRSQLQRSMDVREQQRQIIEARQKGGKSGAPPEGPEAGQRTAEGAAFGPPSRAASNPRRKGPPPGLSILAPSAAAFSNERVIQSAPLHQSFTGLRPHPYSQQPSNLSQTSHIHHVPATQTSNRLPPISDVFAHDSLGAPPSARPNMYASGPSPSQAPLHSPGFPPPHQHQHQHQQQQPPLSARGREFRSAEEAVQELSRGRDDLLPKIVHYGGTQPPTPPSPMPNNQQQYPQSATHAPYQHHQTHGAAPHLDAPRHEFSHPSSGRRRGRDEYERDNGSPLGQQENKRASYMVRDEGEADWRNGMSGPEKRDEFLRLCARAWDLFHS